MDIYTRHLESDYLSSNNSPKKIANTKIYGKINILYVGIYEHNGFSLEFHLHIKMQVKLLNFRE